MGIALYHLDFDSIFELGQLVKLIVRRKKSFKIINTKIF